VNCSADGIALEVGEVQGFGEDALPGESCVAMDEDGKIQVAAIFSGAVLFGAGAAYGDGVDRFEVTRI